MQTDLHEALDNAAPRRVPDLDFDGLLRRHRRAETILQLVDALNTADAKAFIDAFVPEGSFHARGQFNEDSSLFANHQRIADTGMVEPWVRMLVETWGLEAQVHRCADRDDLEPGFHSGGEVVTCEVRTRWPVLSMEITEQWEFEFVDDLLASYRWQPLDLDPPSRTLPLGFTGLEDWEAWLQATDPDAAARLLVARDTCSDDCALQWVEDLSSDDPERAARMAPLVFPATRDWVVDGHGFTPAGLIPYDPELADEIAASIRDYLERQ